MDIKEIGIDTRNCGVSAQDSDYWRALMNDSKLVIIIQAGSNRAEVGSFSLNVKILSTSPPGGTLSWGSRV